METKHTPDDTIKGSCRCGQLHYQLTAIPFYAGYCHCQACRKRNSAPCTSFIMSMQKDMHIEGESTAYSEAGGSGAPLESHRCSECGTAVYSIVHCLKNVVAIPAETLSNREHFAPTAHVWLSSKEPWLEINDDLQQLPGPPGIPLELIRRPG